MKPLALLLVAALLAGCTAAGTPQDPWAYTRKPLYAGGFDLAKLAAAGGSDAQQFRVQDGSIAAIRILVWVNATAGGGTLSVLDPGGRVVLTTAETTERQVPLDLGAWSVRIEAGEDAAGRVHVLAVRA